MKYDLTNAIQILFPNTSWKMIDNDYETLEWFSFEIEKPSLETLQQKLLELNEKEPMNLLRQERNKRLQECDWITLRAYSQQLPVPPEWSSYMQALRDLPNNSSPSLTPEGTLDMSSVSWPIPPTITF
jgi:hypothetical protein